MRETISPEIRAAVRQETAPQLIDWVSWVIGISGVFLLCAIPLNRELGEVVWQRLAVIRVGGGLLQLAAALLLRRMRHAAWPRSVAAAVAVFATGYLATLAVALTAQDWTLLLFVVVLATVGAAIVFPWEVGAQIALIIVATLSVLPIVAHVSPNVLVGVLAAYAISIYIAALLDRQRCARKGEELLRAGLEHALEQVAADSDVREVLDTLLGVLAQQLPGLHCAVLLADEDYAHLHVTASRGLPDGFAHRFYPLPIADGATPSTAAAALGRAVVIADLARDARAGALRQVALAHGLAACWSEPMIDSRGRTLGAFTLYYDQARVPTARERELVGGAMRVAIIAIERRATRDQLARHVAALEHARGEAEEQADRLQRQAVELAEARDEAFASTRAKSEFLANMSHEIRTPLNGVIGLTELLLDAGLPADQHAQVATIGRCGDHLLAVINDILDFSKIEAGKLLIECVEFDLRGVIEDVADVMAPRAHEKGFELVADVSTSLTSRVMGDPGRLRQVLNNLVSNAVKFTDRGEVVLEVRVCDESEAALRVRLAVRDTGIGIPRDRHAAIFESFTQADGSTTRKHGGTGLGLTISRQLVALMGGSLHVDSAPGAGSTFWFELTLRKGAREAAPRVPVERLHGLRVLAVDDNATNRMILSNTLRGWGCRPEEADSGITALAALHAAATDDPFALVILDMQMPELDGAGTAAAIRADGRFAAVPLILLSSIGGLRDASSLGFAAAIGKPVRQATLLRTVCDVLGEPTAEPSAAPAGPVPLAGERLRVLLAEDNTVNRMVALRMLHRLGCAADAVENGREAVEAVARERYDLVLMDVQMPDMDGFEATQMIRRRETNDTRLPIIAMTAHAMQGDRERCLLVGMDDYITKPVTLVALADALARWAPGSRRVDEQRQTGT